MKRWMMTLALAMALVGCGSSNSDSCSAKEPSSCPQNPPRYKADVAPLLKKYCVSCHVAGGSEPSHSFDTYDVVASHRSEIKSELAGCDMPPPEAAQPTTAEREKILAWLVCGAQDD